MSGQEKYTPAFGRQEGVEYSATELTRLKEDGLILEPTVTLKHLKNVPRMDKSSELRSLPHIEFQKDPLAEYSQASATSGQNNML